MYVMSLFCCGLWLGKSVETLSSTILYIKILFAGSYPFYSIWHYQAELVSHGNHYTIERTTWFRIVPSKSRDFLSEILALHIKKTQLTVDAYLKVSIFCSPCLTLVITFQNRSLADLSHHYSWGPGYKAWSSGPVSKCLPFAGVIVTHLVHLCSASARCECDAIWRLYTCVKVKQKNVLIHLPIVLH